MRATISLFLVFFCSGVLVAQKTQDKQLADYVDPNIGGIGQLLKATSPYVQYPFGMVRLAPVTTPGITDRYLADKIYGFPVGDSLLMASTAGAGTQSDAFASDFDHDFETATPYYYSVKLQTWDILAESTATPQAGYYRFTYPSGEQKKIEISLEGDARLNVVDSNAAEGSQRVAAPVAEAPKADGETREYFYAEFSEPFKKISTWSDKDSSASRTQAGDHIGFAADFVPATGEKVEVRFGVSFISAEQARRNLQREIPRWNFDEVKQTTKQVWNTALGAIQTSGGTERQRRIFYTALYRSLSRMTDVTEDGRYFSAYDHKVHEADGHDFYVDDGTWDTFRSLHPLQLLLDDNRQQDMIRSYLRMYEQSGWLPSFPSLAGDQPVMIGHHAAQMILDTYAKGYRDFDLREAYEGLKKDALETTLRPWTGGPATDTDRIYFDKGFYPALAKGEVEKDPEAKERQAVSVTLETSYDDWCLAQMAAILGNKADEAYFTKLAHSYQNMYNPAIGLMAPRSADGQWVKDFDPKLGGRQGGRDYFTEMNAWTYTFNVQHDIAGLIGLMGGRDAFNARLDRLFVEQYGTSKFTFLAQFPDSTGLIGLYAQGNEPSFHIPYLYDFSGQPWKTQFRVRQIMDVWYGDGPLGLAGDDDGGALSSWYVLSAMGFYPVCPGMPVYEIGSPIFAKSEIRLGNGKTFTILANNVSARNKYIQSATLNGKPLDKPWFSHDSIAGGGVLALEMGSRPNLLWGSARTSAPPSMTPQKIDTPDLASGSGAQQPAPTHALAIVK
jgi:predicted alpha-1,2-mannosidase